ncbi:phosphoglycerate dehydrogenase [Brockia lithotrophica]|uniref:D-3-phosphoglycerate dehydrogenase n=1 Tax=Brockia lithotrophica TaxID=933949 RepID=A0A660L6C0_9BACL|nr:phosphoglycerate dehydrogenase [Brockia lithotrophica]RKQ88774.1 D-3-phosphoglycerate dehydrogenase [Brockia lithotrophica]
MGYRIVIADPLSEAGLEPLRRDPEVEIIDVSHEDDPDALVRALRDADALIVRSRTKVTRDLLDLAPRLKVVGRAGVGVDNIDVDAATERGVLVLNAPNGNTIAAAEHAFALLLALARRIPEAHASVKAGRWERQRFIGFELMGKTLGVVGLGRIGSEVAKRARAFGMEVLGYDPYLPESRARSLGIEPVSLEELFRRADIITLHTPLTEETRNLIRRETLALMKDGVILVNAARGGLIDEDALVEAVRSGKVAGVALDVFAEEPPKNAELLALERAVFTPHLGASTVEAQENVARDTSIAILEALRDRPVRTAVNLPEAPSPEAAELLRLGERLGTFAMDVLDGPPVAVDVTFHGEISEAEREFLVRAVLKGVLARQLDVRVNLVNARTLARQRGLEVQETWTSTSTGFPFLVQVRLRGERGSAVQVSGTIVEGLGPRIVEVEGFPVDVPPEGTIVFAHHVDRPGVIGRVGMIFGEKGINIATMIVGRREIGGEAVMLLAVDHTPDEDTLAKLLDIEALRSVKLVRLG